MAVDNSATVSVVDGFPSLPPPDKTTTIIDREGGNPHTVFSYRIIDVMKGGKTQMSVSGPDGTPAKFVDWGSRTAQRHIEWVAARNGALPEIPDYETTDPNLVLLDHEIGRVAPGIHIDGKMYEFWVSGIYRYGFVVPPTKDTGFPLARAPWDSGAVQVLDSKNFSKHSVGG